MAPTKKIFAVLERPAREDEPQARELRVLRWGLVPSWAKEASIGSRMINARAETVAVKPAFRRAFAKRRCILPADGYYEWQAISDGGKKRKQPYFIYRTDGEALAFAGIYELWRDDSLPDDHERAWLWTAAIITTQATDDVGQIHDRMPMVITPEHWADWLDPANTEPGQIHAAMLPAMAGGLTSHPVSMAVNTVRNNGPELIKPLEGADGSGRGFRGQREAARRVVLSPRPAAMAWCQSKPVLPTARGREARTPVETTVARKRLEEMRDDLDRTIAVLQGERPGPVAGTGYPQDSADAGSILSEADRTEAILHSARNQRDEVLAALSRIDEDSYGSASTAATRYPRAGSTPAPTPPAASAASPSGPSATVSPDPAQRGLLAEITSCAPSDSSDRAASSARTSLGSPPGSRRSQCVTTDSENTVRDRIQLTRSPAPVNSSRAWSGP